MQKQQKAMFNESESEIYPSNQSKFSDNKDKNIRKNLEDLKDKFDGKKCLSPTIFRSKAKQKLILPGCGSVQTYSGSIMN